MTNVERWKEQRSIKATELNGVVERFKGLTNNVVKIYKELGHINSLDLCQMNDYLNKITNLNAEVHMLDRIIAEELVEGW